MKIIDMHCDTIYEILEAKKRGETISLRDGKLMVNLNKMKQGGYSVQNFALFVDQESGIGSFETVKELIATFEEEMRENSDLISKVTTADEILENERAGKLSAFLTIEGGEAIEGSLDNLQYVYEQGVRMMTLTWNYPNEIGFPNFKQGMDFFTPNMEDGLTATGIEVVQEMEHLGMIVDVSHLSDAGFYDVLKYTKKPFVASHSNARAVSPWVRNLSDDMIVKLAKRGGVAGLNFCADFLKGQRKSEIIENIGLMASKDACAGFEDILRHARHMANVGGVECIGIGSDFDGIPAYDGMPTPDTMPQLAEYLCKNGFHEREVDLIMHGNVMRLYREVLH